MIAATAMLAAGALGTAPGTAAELLHRHRPVLRFDRSETVLPAAVGGGRPVLYGRHVDRRDGGRWLQYWIYYTDNPQDRGILRTGRHEGDWELVQIRLDAGGRPVRATLRAHTWAQSCSWGELVRTPAGAPIVFVANASHAHYSRPGVHDRPWPDPNDAADGRGRTLRPPVQLVTDRTPRWITSRKRFGDSEASWVPSE